MIVKYLGHATLSIETQGKHLLVDPFFTGNPKHENFDPASIRADYILLTHAHGDHVADVEAIANETGAQLISNFEIITHYGNKGLKGHPLNHGGKWNFDFGTLKYVNAIHTSAFPDGSNGGVPGGFVLWNAEGCLYIAGDTALTMDMQLIPITCPPLDLAVLPIGDNFTMGYEDATIAAEYISCDRILGYHYDTFGYIEIDHNAAKEAFKKKGKELFLLNIGESIEV